MIGKQAVLDFTGVAAAEISPCRFGSVGISVAHAGLLIEIDHLHRDAVVFVVDGRHLVEAVGEIQFIQGREKDRIGDSSAAGLNCGFVRIRAHTDIRISPVIPRDQLRGVVAVLSAFHIDADGIIGKDLPACQLRRKILLGVRIVKLVVLIRLLGDRIEILREFPLKGGCAVAEPHDLAALGIAGIQGTVAVDRIQIIL